MSAPLSMACTSPSLHLSQSHLECLTQTVSQKPNPQDRGYIDEQKPMWETGGCNPAQGCGYSEKGWHPWPFPRFGSINPGSSAVSVNTHVLMQKYPVFFHLCYSMNSGPLANIPTLCFRDTAKLLCNYSDKKDLQICFNITLMKCVHFSNLQH